MDIDQQAAAWLEIRETFKVNQTANGPGSTIEYTAPLREWLPKIIADYDVFTIVDAPCGDLNWMGLVDLSACDYYGIDIDPSMITLNQARYPQHQFAVGNMLELAGLDYPPRVDLFICRDFLFHLPNEWAQCVLENIKLSGARLLLTTTMAEVDNEPYVADNLGDGADDRPGYWYRPINMEAPPFNLDRIAALREDDGREMILVQLWND